MRNVSVLVLIFIANVAVAQSTAVKLNILSPIFRTANFSLEQKIGEQSSFQVGFYYTDLKRNDQGFSGIGITPEYRYYLGSTPAINGLYIAPFLRYTKLNIEGDFIEDGQRRHVEADLIAFGGGVVVGRQWVFKERITIDMFIGPRGMSRDLKVKSGAEDDFKVNLFTGFGLRGGVTFGVAF